MELPFMTTKSGEAASVAAWKFTQKYLMDDFKDVQLIAAHMHGPGLVHKKGPSVKAVEDFKGLKLRGPSRAATLLLDKLGATPIGMPVPAFPEALSKGVVDGGVITWEMSPSLKLDELTDSHTDVAGDKALYNLYFIWAMNKDKYDSMPADLQAIIDANSGEWAGRAHDEGDVVGKQVMTADGNEIGVLSEAETARIMALGEEVTAEWIAEATDKGLAGAALVEDAKAFLPAPKHLCLRTSPALWRRPKGLPKRPPPNTLNRLSRMRSVVGRRCPASSPLPTGVSATER
ncbi:Solute-binding protein [Nymphon striatum]|nr:Solute-binding protein [Nymphon striatum]